MALAFGAFAKCPQYCRLPYPVAMLICRQFRASVLLICKSDVPSAVADAHLPAVQGFPPQVNAVVVAADLLGGHVDDGSLRGAQPVVHRAVAAVHARRHEGRIVLVDRGVHPFAVQAVPPALDLVERWAECSLLANVLAAGGHDQFDNCLVFNMSMLILLVMQV